MKKGITPIIAIVLLLMMTVAAFGLTFVWVQSTQSDLQENVGEDISAIREKMSTCISIESVSEHNVYLRNCGEGILKSSLLSVYIDGIPTASMLSPLTVDPEDVGTITLNLTNVPIKNTMDLKITSSGTVPATARIRPLKNLIDNPGFEEGVWGPAGDCNCGICSCAGGSCSAIPGGSGCGIYALPPQGGCDAFFTAFTAEGYSGSNSLNLTGQNAVACNAKDMNDFESGKTYTFSFKYKHISGIGGNYCIWVGGCNTCNPAIPAGTLTSTEWSSYTITFNPEVCTTQLSPFFYAGSSVQISENHYDDVYLIAGFELAK